MARIEGRNPVLEALRGKRRIHRVILQEGVSGDIIDDIKNMANEKDISITSVLGDKLDDLSRSHAHQGVMAEADDLKLSSPEKMVELAKSRGEKSLIIVLDQIQDPHNFGAIIRTAFAAGAHGLIFQERRAVGITPVVLKASAGAAEHLPLAQVTNINYTIKDLKEAGLWIAGADLSAEQDHFAADLKGALGLVIGNEGSGLRRLVKENCDFLLKIPMEGKLGSLNASVAAGVIIYEAIRQRG